MKKMKNNLDEMQEQKLLHIEHNGVWFVFWALLLAIIVQVFVYGVGNWKEIMGEWIVFMCLCVYMIAACLKDGIWDRRFKPTLKCNLIFSICAGIVTGGIFFAFSYMNYHAFWGSVATFVILFLEAFVLCFVAMSLLGKVYKKRVEHLEQEAEE